MNCLEFSLKLEDRSLWGLFRVGGWGVVKRGSVLGIRDVFRMVECG